jgi:AraC family transcriptional regulator of adaptative response/methylated-DNA-[protein]-cysteine methyltransferase
MQLGFDLGAEPKPEQAPAFTSPSDFASTLATWQENITNPLPNAKKCHAHPVETPLGTMVAICDADTLHLLEFADRAELPREVHKLAKTTGLICPGQTAATSKLMAELTTYFAGALTRFTLPLALHGTDFTKSVWAALTQIPHGTTQSYGTLAQSLGQPNATRAVARANGANQIAIVVPCHRVIGADGTLTGYAGGLWRKRALLDLESRPQNSAAPV